MTTMGMHVPAQIFLMWTGFLRLETLVKKKYMKGNSRVAYASHSVNRIQELKYFILS